MFQIEIYSANTSPVNNSHFFRSTSKCITMTTLSIINLRLSCTAERLLGAQVKKEGE